MVLLLGLWHYSDSVVLFSFYQVFSYVTLRDYMLNFYSKEFLTVCAPFSYFAIYYFYRLFVKNGNKLSQSD
jgi:hypothetical protein